MDGIRPMLFPGRSTARSGKESSHERQGRDDRDRWHAGVRGPSGGRRSVARRVAGEGYVALAPDLYHRSGKLRTAGYDELPKALELMGALKDDQIVADVSSAIGWLERQATVKAGRVGITGFCMGGRVSYVAACALPDKITASAPFYGGGIPIDRTATLKAPVLAFFGD